MYKSLNSILPAFLQNLFIFNHNKHSYATRQHSNLYVPRSKTNLCKFSIKYHGLKTWNNISPDIRHLQSLHFFKRKLKEY